MTWTIRGFVACRRTSAAATSGIWLPTMMEEASRGSRVSQRSMLQSLQARASSIGEVRIVVTCEMAVVSKGEDGPAQVGGIQKLRAQGRVIGAGLAASFRVRVRAHESVRVGHAVLHGERDHSGAHATGDVLAPPARHVLDQLGVDVPSVMDVAVDYGSGLHRLSMVS
jgi:hypothetical protein